MLLRGLLGGGRLGGLAAGASSSGGRLVAAAAGACGRAARRSTSAAASPAMSSPATAATTTAAVRSLCLDDGGPRLDAHRLHQRALHVLRSQPGNRAPATSCCSSSFRFCDVFGVVRSHLEHHRRGIAAGSGCAKRAGLGLGDDLITRAPTTPSRPSRHQRAFSPESACISLARSSVAVGTIEPWPSTSANPGAGVLAGQVGCRGATRMALPRRRCA